MKRVILLPMVKAAGQMFPVFLRQVMFRTTLIARRSLQPVQVAWQRWMWKGSCLKTNNLIYETR